MELVLRALKEETDERVRATALNTALNKNLDVPSSLLGSLVSTDPSANIRFLALEALQADPNIRAIAEQRVLLDPDPHVKNRANEILWRLDGAAYPPGAVVEPAQQRTTRQSPQTPPK